MHDLLVSVWVQQSPANGVSGSWLRVLVAPTADWWQHLAVDIKKPDEDAYGRVANPGRYQPVVDAARALIERLVEDYDVEHTMSVAADAFPSWLDPDCETVKLVPGCGVAVTFMITKFPGVLVSLGERGHRVAFPSCGCDACDEDPAEEIEELKALVEAITVGAYSETLTRKGWETRYSGDFGLRSQVQYPKSFRWRQHGKLGTTVYAPWPSRSSG